MICTSRNTEDDRQTPSQHPPADNKHWIAKNYILRLLSPIQLSFSGI